MYTIFSWIYKILDIQFPRKTKHSVHLMHTISRWIYAVLDFQFICKSKLSVHLMYTISHRIYLVLYFQFICKSRHYVRIMYIISLLNLYISGYSISLQIQIFRKYIMYTISRWICEILDIQFLHKTRHSVHLIYTISCWIFAVLDF